ncbi:MAG: LemA family protein [Negativicutes bacterium]|nr:LemA family protein [Negativicutes bacterium]
MGISGYNSLVSLNENVNGKWAQVENQLQRRADLIPNLVSTVQGVAAQERAVIQSVTDARAKLAGAQGPAAKAEANDQLSGALSRLLVVVENYPQIKSDKNFRALQDELAGTENRLAVARQDYNNAVQIFNAKIQSFPSVLYARMFGFAPKEYFKAAEGAKQVPQVKF